MKKQILRFAAIALVAMGLLGTSLRPASAGGNRVAAESGNGAGEGLTRIDDKIKATEDDGVTEIGPAEGIDTPTLKPEVDPGVLTEVDPDLLDKGLETLDGTFNQPVTSLSYVRHAHSITVNIQTAEPVKWVGVILTPQYGNATGNGFGLSGTPKTNWSVNVVNLSPGNSYTAQIEVPTPNGNVLVSGGGTSTLTPHVTATFKRVKVHDDSDPGCGEMKFGLYVHGAKVDTGEYCISTGDTKWFGFPGIMIADPYPGGSSTNFGVTVVEYDDAPNPDDHADKFQGIDLHSPYQSDNSWNDDFSIYASDGDELKVTVYGTYHVSYS